MAKYDDFFVNVMMVEELGLQVPDPDDDIVKEGTSWSERAITVTLACAAQLSSGVRGMQVSSCSSRSQGSGRCRCLGEHAITTPCFTLEGTG